MEESTPRSAFSNTEVTLRDYLRIIFRHKWIVIMSILAVSATVAFGLKLQTAVYTASVKMLVSSEKQTQAPYSREIAGGGRSEVNITQSVIVKSAPVVERAVKAVHLDKRPIDAEKDYASGLRRKIIERQTLQFNDSIQKFSTEQKDYIFFRRAVDTLQQNLTVEPVRGTNLLLVSVQDFDPLVAATLANVVSRSYVIFDLEQQLAESATKYGDLHPTVSLLKGHIEGMNKTLNGQPLENIDAIGPATVKIISQASIPTRPDGKNKKLVFVLAAFLSVILGVGLSFIFEYLDPTVRSPQDLGNITKIPLIATIPQQRNSRKVLLNAVGKYPPPYMDAYHELACQIRFFVGQKGLKTFLFTAPDVGEGTTTVVSNLGLCLAKDFKKKVLIIDAHYHKAGLHKNFDQTPGPGLSEALSGSATFAQVCREIEPNLWILTAGDAQAKSENYLDTKKMADLIAQAKKDFEIVLIDTADLRNYRDTFAMGNLADGLILVVSEGKTRRPAIMAATAPLKESNFNILGTVLNRRTYALPKFVYERV
jgi:capsular exopolysaccharide synthesis family protein